MCQAQSEAHGPPFGDGREKNTLEIVVGDYFVVVEKTSEKVINEYCLQTLKTLKNIAIAYKSLLKMLLKLFHPSSMSNMFALASSQMLYKHYKSPKAL